MSRFRGHGVVTLFLVTLIFSFPSKGINREGKLGQLLCKLELARRARRLPGPKLPANREIWPEILDAINIFGQDYVRSSLVVVPAYPLADPDYAAASDFKAAYPKATDVRRYRVNGGIYLYVDIAQLPGDEYVLKNKLGDCRRFIPFQIEEIPGLFLVRTMGMKDRREGERFLLVFHNEAESWDYIGRVYHFFIQRRMPVLTINGLPESLLGEDEWTR